MSEGFQLVLSGGTDAAWVARRAIANNDPSLPGPLLDDLSLLVTELVTNAVLHGGATADGAVQIGIQRRADCIRVDVIDRGTDFDPPAPGSNGNSGGGGWGLVLVDRIAERWGIHPVPSGKCVWFELPVGATI
jgi:anti-sigma regulatory factor (Ser/Thr protein kinase)